MEASAALPIICLTAGAGAGWLTGRAAEASAALKMLAASAYIAFAWQLGALATPYGRLVLAALAASWIGDLLLISESNGNPMRAGIGAFLVAHLLYAAAFLGREPSALYGAAPAVLMLLVSTATLKWLTGAGLAGRMRDAVIVYLAAISAMVALAVATGSVVAAAGAIAFAVSDLFVARERFVIRSVWNRRLGLPIYFGAQLLLALSITAI